MASVEKIKSKPERRAVGRPRTKGGPLQVKLRLDLRDYLVSISQARKVTMVQVLEELLERSKNEH